MPCGLFLIKRIAESTNDISTDALGHSESYRQCYIGISYGLDDLRLTTVSELDLRSKRYNADWIDRAVALVMMPLICTRFTVSAAPRIRYRSRGQRKNFV